MQISHKHLEAFHAVVTAGGFTRAARLLRTSQPSVSRLIAQLQEAVAFPLFTTIQGHKVPTAEALTLNQEVERSFHGLEKVMQHAARIGEHRVGHLRIVCMPALAQSFLPQVLASFLRDRPGVSGSLQVQRSESITDWMNTQQFDVGFSMLPVERPGVEIESFDAAPGFCVMQPGHALARKRFVDIRDLAGIPFVGCGPNSLVQHVLNNAFEAAGVKCDIRVESPITAIACELVLEGAGATIADLYTAHAYRRHGLVARPFRPEIHFEFGVLYPAHRARSALVRQFVAAADVHRQRLYKELGRPAPASSRR